MSDSFQLKAIITGVDKLSPVLSGIQQNIKKAGKGFKNAALVTTAMGMGLATAFVKPIQDAVEFESHMSDVRKVVNFDSPKQFAQMSQDILDMSTRLPMAANDIATIVAAGGQAGIAASGLEQFATDAVKMGVAFDQTAQSSGQEMAQWRVSLGLTQAQVETLGDQINYLGNTGPVASNQLTDVLTRVGTLGKLAHLSAGEIAALGATVSAAGIQTDVAATGIKRVITTLAGGHITKLQRAAFHALRLNPKKVAADMQKDGKKAILEVFTALSHVAPGKQIGITKALFGQESLEAIAPLLANIKLLIDNFNKVGDATKYAGSMQKEYEIRSATTANQMQLFSNNINRISTEIGESLTPALNDSLKQMTPLLDEVSNFVKNNPEVVKVAAGAAAGLIALGGIAVIATLVAAVGPIGVLLAALVGAGTYLTMHWDELNPKGNPMAPTPMTDDQKTVADAYSYTNKVPMSGTIFDTQAEVQQQLHLTDMIKLLTSPFPAALFTPGAGGRPAYPYNAPSTDDFLSDSKNHIQGEMVVRFENMPPGVRVSEGKTNTPDVRMVPDVGYSQFSPMSLMR